MIDYFLKKFKNNYQQFSFSNALYSMMSKCVDTWPFCALFVLFGLKNLRKIIDFSLGSDRIFDLDLLNNGFGAVHRKLNFKKQSAEYRSLL